MRNIKRALFLALFAIASSVQAGTFLIDSRQTFLLGNSDPAPAAVPFSFAVLGVAPGDTILLTRLGDFNCNATCGDISVGMLGLFSSNDTVLASNLLNRVPGAIDAGVDVVTSPTHFGSIATDIPQDFSVLGTGTVVTIPSGAAFLFITASDSLYNDNWDPDPADFAVSIERIPGAIPEPESYAMLLAGLGLLGYVARRRKLRAA